MRTYFFYRAGCFVCRDSFLSVLNTFSVTIAKRSHIMTNFILLGARKTTCIRNIFYPLFFITAAQLRCNRFFADAPAVFYVSSLTKSLLCFEVALETASGIVGISAFALYIYSRTCGYALLQIPHAERNKPL